MFGTGETGVAGGEELTEAQSNKNGYRFDNYDVTGVEEAPKSEKVSYNLAGPENAGVTVKENEPESLNESAEGVAKEIDADKTVVFLSAGHAAEAMNDWEFNRSSGLLRFAIDVASAVNNSASGATHAADLQVSRGLYSYLFNTDASDYTPGSNKTVLPRLQKELVSYGVFKKKSGDYVPVYEDAEELTKSNYAAFYKKYHKKINKLLHLMDTKSRAGKGSADDYVEKFLAGHAFSGTAITEDKYLKAKSTSGCSYKAAKEYEINYYSMKYIGSYLESKGYKVIYCKDSANTVTLNNKSEFSNRNLALYANDSNAVVHFVIHWDSSGNKKGLHTITVKSSSTLNLYSNSTESDSESVADAMYEKKSSAFSGKNVQSSGYTTLNWATCPTVITELGWMEDKDFADVYSSDKKELKKNLKERCESIAPCFKAGIDAVASE